MGYLRLAKNSSVIIPRKPVSCKAQNITSILNCKSWEGKRAFIICGGPSLQGFDFSKIQFDKTIGINKAFTKFPTDINYGMDQRFFDRVNYPDRCDTKEKELHDAWTRYKGIKLFLNSSNNSQFARDVYYVTGLDKAQVSLDISQGVYAGKNSGFGGMMIAIALGCRQIYMLGLDLKINETTARTHWHDGYKNQDIDSIRRVLNTFKKEFEKFAGSIKELGINVINLNPDSALDCFPKQDIREVL